MELGKNHRKHFENILEFVFLDDEKTSIQVKNLVDDDIIAFITEKVLLNTEFNNSNKFIYI